MNTKYIELLWDEEFEPLYGSPILLPPNTLLWRGYDTRYEAIPERYTYYGDMNLAYNYAQQQHRDVGCFATTRELKLMDIRFMMSILERVIGMNKSDANINDFVAPMLSFGLCSLSHQIRILKERYNNKSQKITEGIGRMITVCDKDNIIEQKGIRVGETINDGITMAFLQELFKGYFDGFIAPKIETVFHSDGYIDSEMLLFNPKRSNIKRIMEYPGSNNIVHSKISDLLSLKYKIINLQISKGTPISMKMYMKKEIPIRGGQQNERDERDERDEKRKTHYMDKIDYALNSNNDIIRKYYNEAVKAGKRWNRKVSIKDMIPKREEVCVNMF